MISTINPAFEFLRQHKSCSEETEALVMKKTKGRITPNDLFTAFENGIAGQYGKVYAADAQTLMNWVDGFLRGKTSIKNYLETGLLDPTKTLFELNNSDWAKESNKCYNAFLNGVSEIHFHPHVYDHMMLDGKIEFNSYLKYFEDGEDEKAQVSKAKQKILRDVFLTYKSKGWSQVYVIK